jgi:Ran GTPase-activating protein (RanGAP) involved in mRNA processing and transport
LPFAAAGVGDPGCAALLWALRRCAPMATLDLSFTGYASRSIVALSTLLEAQPSITHLELAAQNNPLAPLERELLASVVRAHAHRLLAFHVECTPSDIDGTPTCISALQHPRSMLRSLGVGMPHQSGRRLCPAVRGVLHSAGGATLETLAIGLRSIDIEHCLMLAEGLRHTRSLTSLDMEGETFSGGGVHLLVAALVEARCPIESLILVDSPIDDEGATAISELAIQRPTLRTLLLQACQLSAVGLALICSAFEARPASALRRVRLDLRHNPSDATTLQRVDLLRARTLPIVRKQ